jgi:hypothetical protein
VIDSETQRNEQTNLTNPKQTNLQTQDSAAEAWTTMQLFLKFKVDWERWLKKKKEKAKTRFLPKVKKEEQTNMNKQQTNINKDGKMNASSTNVNHQQSKNIPKIIGKTRVMKHDTQNPSNRQDTKSLLLDEFQ